MKCYNHPNQDAIAQCVDCGKGLCQECETRWDPPICDSCQNSRANAELASLNRELMLYVGLAIAGIVFGFFMVSSMASSAKQAGFGGLGGFGLVFTYGLAFPIYAAGWKWLNHLTDHFTLLATPMVWIIYLIVKLMFSAVVGMLALPYRLFSIFKRKSEIHSIMAYK